MPEDARRVMKSAAAMLVMNRSIMDTGLTTIRIQSQLIEAIGNEIRAAGCEFNPVTGAVVNPMSVPEGYVLVPVEPTPGVLMSMALRSDHALAFPGHYDHKLLRYPGAPTHQQRLDSALGLARSHYEEVVGAGFYSTEKEADYAAMLAARPETPDA